MLLNQISVNLGIAEQHIVNIYIFFEDISILINVFSTHSIYFLFLLMSFCFYFGEIFASSSQGMWLGGPPSWSQGDSMWLRHEWVEVTVIGAKLGM